MRLKEKNGKKNPSSCLKRNVFLATHCFATLSDVPMKIDFLGKHVMIHVYCEGLLRLSTPLYILLPTELHLKNVYYLYSASSNPTNMSE